VLALHFLEEDQVGPDFANRLAQLAQHEATAQEGEALVGVHREHAQAEKGRGSVHRMAAEGQAFVFTARGTTRL